MNTEVIRARLLIRLAGLLLGAMCLPRLAVAVAALGDPAWWNSGPDWVNGILHFYSLPIDTGRLVGWLLAFGVPAGAFAVGVMLLARGSRWLERKVTRVIQGS